MINKFVLIFTCSIFTVSSLHHIPLQLKYYKFLNFWIRKDGWCQWTHWNIQSCTLTGSQEISSIQSKILTWSIPGPHRQILCSEDGLDFSESPYIWLSHCSTSVHFLAYADDCLGRFCTMTKTNYFTGFTHRHSSDTKLDQDYRANLNFILISQPLANFCSSSYNTLLLCRFLKSHFQWSSVVSSKLSVFLLYFLSADHFWKNLHIISFYQLSIPVSSFACSNHRIIEWSGLEGIIKII